MRLDFRSRWRNTFCALSPTDEVEENLRLPVEVILRIADESVALRATKPACERVALSLRLVNRTFARYIPRFEGNICRLSSVACVQPLVQSLKTMPSLARRIEGVVICDLGRLEARMRLKQDWKKLRGLCPRLEFLEWTPMQARFGSSDGLETSVLHALKGVSTLRLVRLHLRQVPTPPSLLHRSGGDPPLFPPHLRHLFISNVEVHNATVSPSLLPTPPHFQLTIVSLVNLSVADDDPQRSRSLALTRILLERTAPSLKALHYSRWQNEDDRQWDPLDLGEISFPSLRIASFRLLQFPPSFFLAAPNLEHLSLYPPGMYSRVLRGEHVAAVLSSIARALLDMPGWRPALRLLDLPDELDWLWNYRDNVPPKRLSRTIPALRDVVEAAKQKGVEVRFMDPGTVGEERFKSLVQGILKERV